MFPYSLHSSKSFQIVFFLFPSQAEDTGAPVIMKCPSFGIVETSDSATTVSWVEPTAVDDSGNVTLLMKTHSSGDTFPVGLTTVIYVFADSSNNIASCTFVVRVSRGLYVWVDIESLK